MVYLFSKNNQFNQVINHIKLSIMIVMNFNPRISEGLITISNNMISINNFQYEPINIINEYKAFFIINLNQKLKIH